MLLREFIKRCETGYNDILISDGSGNGYYFDDMKSIPEELKSCKVIFFDSGFGYDAVSGLKFGLHIVVRKLPEERR